MRSIPPRILMVFTAILWSGAFITGKIATPEFPPFALTFFRFFIAFPFVFLLLYQKQKGNLFPTKKQWPVILLMGLTGTFIYHSLFFYSLKYTTAINSSLIGATNPMITALLSLVFFHDKITPSRIFGFILSFLGIFLTVTHGDLHVIYAMELNIGDLFMLVAVCFFAIYSLIGQRLMKKYDISPLMATTYNFLVCIVIAFPFFLRENPLSYLPHTTAGGWLSIAYMSIFASVLGYVFHLSAVQNIGAPSANVFINLVPVLTFVQSVLILGEPFSLLKLFCAALVITGVYLASRPGKNLPSGRGTAVSSKA